MSKVQMTVRQIIDLGLWDKVCDYKSWNPWILNEGRIDYNEIVEFDSEFKKEDEKIKYSRDSWAISVEQLEEWKNLLDDTNSHRVYEDIKTITGEIEDILEQCI